MRKKQERLAKGRLVLLDEQEKAENNVIVPEVAEPNQDHPNFHDELEVENDEIIHKEFTNEPDALDMFMMEIEKDAVPQEKDREVEPEVQDNLDDEEYYEKFMKKFTKPEEVPQEPEGKPEVLYNDELDLAWDMLLEEDENEVFLKKVRNTQQRAVHDKCFFKAQTVEYEAYRKNFYIVCPDLAQLSKPEVEKIREDLGDIQVRGKTCPAPILNWFQCGLSDKTLKLLDSKNFSGPFPIQAQVLPT